MGFLVHLEDSLALTRDVTPHGTRLDDRVDLVALEMKENVVTVVNIHVCISTVFYLL